MRIIRYRKGQEEPRFGWVLEDKAGPIEGTPFGDYRRLEADIPLSEVTLLSPLVPGKIICFGVNYTDHAREIKAEVPEYPLMFLKPATSVIGPGETILIPPQSTQVEHEAELVVVIGKKGRWISPTRAEHHILGYTVGNDVTARDLQHHDGQWIRSKSFDTFCPLGPWIETDFDPTDALITCRVNGEMRQMASTHEMIFNPSQLVAFASTVMTLYPGDIIMTGTPAGIGPLLPKDVVEVSIDGIGTLSNPVAADQGIEIS